MRAMALGMADGHLAQADALLWMIHGDMTLVWFLIGGLIALVCLFVWNEW
jgi:hypothetical protein